MRVDIATLRMMEREKGLGFETIVEALESALASAYKRSHVEAEDARVTIDRASGDVTIFAQELDDAGNVVREWEDSPSDFGRIVAQTAKQVLMQRLREAERELTYGEYSGREGDLVTGTVQIHDVSTRCMANLERLDLQGLIVVGVGTLLDGNPINNFVERAATFNPDGILYGASAITIVRGGPSSPRVARTRRPLQREIAAERSPTCLRHSESSSSMALGLTRNTSTSDSVPPSPRAAEPKIAADAGGILHSLIWSPIRSKNSARSRARVMTAGVAT